MNIFASVPNAFVIGLVAAVLPASAFAQSLTFSRDHVVFGDDAAHLSACQPWGTGQPDPVCLQNVARWPDVAAASRALQTEFGERNGLYTLSGFQELGEVDFGWASSHQFHENPQGPVFLNGNVGVLRPPTGASQLAAYRGSGDAAVILRTHPNAGINWEDGRLTGYSVNTSEGEEQTFYISYSISSQAGSRVSPLVGSAIVPYIFWEGEPYFSDAPLEVRILRSQMIQQRLPETGPIATALMQQVLNEAGFDPGPVDGVLGARTVRALQNFQWARCLPATGMVDAATRLHLVSPIMMSETCLSYHLNQGYETLESAGLRGMPTDGPDLFNFGPLLNSAECTEWCIFRANASYLAHPLTLTPDLARTVYSAVLLDAESQRSLAHRIHPTTLWDRSGAQAMLIVQDPCPTGENSCLHGLLLSREDDSAGYLVANIFPDTEALASVLADAADAAGLAEQSNDGTPAQASLSDCAGIAEATARLACFDAAVAPLTSP